MNLKKSLAFVLLTFSLTACANDAAPDNSTSKNLETTVNQGQEGEFASPELQKEIEAEMARIEAEETKKINEDYALVRELEDLEEAKKEGSKAKGSCNSIDDASTCIEYYGSIWTAEQIKFNCEGAGTFSLEPCPDDMAGGCNTGYGTPADMVAWMYTRGGGEITAESLKYAKMACDATMAAKWISTK